MCFGNSQKTETKTENKDSSSYIPAWLTAAGQANLAKLFGSAEQGYTQYAGPKVADLSTDENSAFNIFRTLAGSQNPYSDTLQDTYATAATQGPSQITGQGVLDGRSVGDYMDPNLQYVLAPQLADIDRDFNDRGKNLDAKATIAGAYGDVRAGFDKESNERLRNDARARATGNVLQGAYNTALGAKTADINRDIGVQTTNAGLIENALLRALQGGQALQGLDKYNTGRAADLATLLSGAGATQRAVDQGKLSGAYEEHTKSQGSLLDWAKLLSSSIASTPHDTQTVSTGVTTTEKPDNSGFGLLGSLAGSLFGPTIKGAGTALAGAILSDRRKKEEIERIGMTFDGQPIYRFRYIGSPVVHIGLMAQDVERVTPDAVIEHDGTKYVDYRAATNRAAEMAVH